jgi:pimeloyl-ACP methyl ester carboxylesterase
LNNKTLRFALIAIVFVFALVGVHKTFLAVQYFYTKHWIEKVESTRKFDPDLWYYADGGKPLFLVNSKNTATLFFLEGFRTQSPSGMYESFFRELFEKHGINIVAPVYGLQSSPFQLRNRDWNFREDLRTATQVYDAFAANIPNSHRIITVGQSFGALPIMAILAKAQRRPDAAIFLSPLNSALEFRASGDLAFWLSKQAQWLQYFMLFAETATPPTRASPWDIVNHEINKKILARNDGNPEDSVRYGVQSEEAGNWMEANLLPQVHNYPISIFYGDSDLYFADRGFQNLANLLTQNGNRVAVSKLPNSGHMVLLDNQAELVRRGIFASLKSEK